MGGKTSRKVSRKLTKCENMLLKYENFGFSKYPSHSLFIGNGGLGCGFTREMLMDIFSAHGNIKRIVMLIERPYSFIVFSEIEEATQALTFLQGRKMSAEHTFYLAYICDTNVPQEIVQKNSWPDGLVLLEDFINEEEEKELLASICIEENDDAYLGNSILKHRQVKHYGYEFIYGFNNINKNMPLERKIPEVCLPHLKKLVSLGYLPKIPEQLTVNHYLPGQGIPPHIDTHSPFEDGIVSLSLSSQVVMDFYGPEKQTVSILLPRRSALIMLGESRFLWKHGITPRKTDIVTTPEDNLTLSYRSPRTSLTFRIVRDGPCKCDYKDQCDSQAEDQLVEKDLINDDEAEELEHKYVNKVYEELPEDFSNKRYKPWPKVVEFLRSVNPGSIFIDVGCGNGKNMNHTVESFEIGCDSSLNLTKICAREGEVLNANCLNLPFRDECADAVVCIAVIHHLSTKSRRIKALKEIIRILRPKGRALISVWAMEQIGPDGPSSYLKKYSDFIPSNVKKIELSSSKTIQVPINVDRSEFSNSDILVPWTETNIFEKLRYYHLFQENELYSLVTSCGVSAINSSYYDSGSWCIIFEK